MRTIYFKEKAVPRTVLEQSKRSGYFITSRTTPYWLGSTGKAVRVRMSGDTLASDVGTATIVEGPNTRKTFLGGDDDKPGAHIELRWTKGKQ